MTSARESAISTGDASPVATHVAAGVALAVAPASMTVDQARRLSSGFVDALRAAQVGVDTYKLRCSLEQTLAPLTVDSRIDVRTVIHDLGKMPGVEEVQFFSAVRRFEVLARELGFGLVEPRWGLDESTRERALREIEASAPPAPTGATPSALEPVLTPEARGDRAVQPIAVEAERKKTTTSRPVASRRIRGIRVLVGLCAAALMGLVVHQFGALSATAYPEMPLLSAEYQDGSFVATLDLYAWAKLTPPMKKKSLDQMAQRLIADNHFRGAAIVDSTGRTIIWARPDRTMDAWPEVLK